MAKIESIQPFVTVFMCTDCGWTDLEFESDEESEDESNDSEGESNDLQDDLEDTESKKEMTN